MIKINVVDLYDFYNFVVDNIFHLKSFTIPKFYSNSYILKFKFWIVETVGSTTLFLMTFPLEIIYYFKIVEVHKNSRRKKRKRTNTWWHAWQAVLSSSLTTGPTVPTWRHRTGRTTSPAPRTAPLTAPFHSHLHGSKYWLRGNLASGTRSDAIA